MTVLLLDASVWLAARDADDDDHMSARRLVAGAQPLAALDLTLYEVANVATRGWRSPERARIVAGLVREACCGSIARVDDPLIERAITIAEEHRLSVYDASYVAAAEMRGWKLVSLDFKDLVRAGLAVTPAAAAAG